MVLIYFHRISYWECYLHSLLLWQNIREKQVKEGSVYFITSHVGVQFILASKLLYITIRQETETANVSIQLAFCFLFSPGSQPTGQCHTHLRLVFESHLTYSRDTLTNISWVISGPVKLKIDISNCI